MKLVVYLQVVIVIISTLLINDSVAIDVGFEEEDQSYREGRSNDSLFLQKGITPNDITVTILLQTVAEFEADRINSGRLFPQDVLDAINDITSFAEAGADFNNGTLEVVFGADQRGLAIEINDSIIINDNINEGTETFVMVLDEDPSIEFLDNRAVLLFNILDNDPVMLGFSQTSFSFEEDAGNLTDVFSVIILGNAVSQQDLTVNVSILVDSSSISATPGQDADFRPVDGLYSYLLTLPAGQPSVFLNPIEIIDDPIIEGDERFFIGLMAGPGAGAAGFAIFFDNMLATVIIIDNDVPSPSPSPTIRMGGDPHYSIMLPSGQLLCYSVHGEKNFPFNLISNDLLQMNAFFIEDALREEITWIGSLGVVVKHTHYKKSNMTKIRFEASEQMIYINNGVSLHAKRVEKLTLANGKLTVSEAVRKGVEKKPEVEVDIIDAGLSFSVRFVKKRHLDMAWKNVAWQPSDTHGILGQFMRKGVEIDKVSKLLYLPNLPPVPVMRSSVWHFMEREDADSDQQFCWQAMNPGYQGKRLIEGNYLDYLVDDVLTSDFKFNPTSNEL